MALALLLPSRGALFSLQGVLPNGLLALLSLNCISYPALHSR